MKMKELLNSLPYLFYQGNENIDIRNIVTDSRVVKEGDLFVCIKGERSDGHSFIREVLDKGVIGVVVEQDTEVDGNVLRVRNTRKALAQLCSRFYGYPSNQLEIVGVTGTNGKTSITHFLNQLYKDKGIRTGLIGTMYHEINGVKVISKNTTPFANELQELFKQMEGEKVQKVFMEVSSHALAMGRVWGVPFQHAIFTNLTQDHLDYHGTMDEYRQAKSLLFTSLGSDFKSGKTAILNADDPTSLIYEEQIGTHVLTYGIENKAEIQAVDIVSTNQGLSFSLVYRGQIYPVHTSVVGEFNIYNLLAAVSYCLVDGWSLEDLSNDLSSLNPVKGRMEKVQSRSKVSVIVDYAHTPDGLESVLKTLQNTTNGKIITVFGCGGDRDRGKRPIMGSIADKYSDYIILTSDNPRSEEPVFILKDIEKGMESSQYEKVVNRKEAIEKAIEMAGEDDVVLIAGKGHEEYQLLGDMKLPFSDTEVAKAYLEEKRA